MKNTKSKSVEIIILETSKDKGFIQHYPNNITLKEMQGIVGGYIELLPIGNEEFMVINEEGLLLNLPINKLAKEYLLNKSPRLGEFYNIVGDVFIINSKNLK